MKIGKISNLDIIKRPDEDFIESLGYDEIHKQFKWEVPEYFNWAIDVVDKFAEDKEKLAMIWLKEGSEERKFTFDYFSTKSNRFANVLEELGMKKGDRLLIMLPNIPELWIVELGCIKNGVVYIPSTTMLTSKDLKFRLDSSKAKAVVIDSSNASKIDEIRKECPSVKHFVIFGGDKDGWLSYEKLMIKSSEKFSPKEKTKSSEPHLIYFTSGTTGLPKMVLHTNVSYPMGHIITGRFWVSMKTTDLHWNLSSPGWAKHAWSSVYGPWNSGAAIFVYEYAGYFDPKKHLEILSKYTITTFCAVPTIWRMFILEDLSKYKFVSLRECVSAGEPLNPEVIKKWEEHTGITIRDGYGQTETVCLIANFPGIDVRPGSMGKQSPGFNISVIDENGNELPAGTEGDIAIKLKPERPVGLMKEYMNDPERTRKVYRGDWYLTGDRAIKDKDGYFWFIGRSDDVIKSSGYRIGPFEVENTLIEHKAVAESAVVGIPDPEGRGQLVKAYIVLKSGYEASEKTAKEIVDFTKKATAPYKHPRVVEFVDKLPKTVSGKIKRADLRKIDEQRYNDLKEGKTVSYIGEEFKDL